MLGGMGDLLKEGNYLKMGENFSNFVGGWRGRALRLGCCDTNRRRNLEVAWVRAV